MLAVDTAQSAFQQNCVLLAMRRLMAFLASGKTTVNKCQHHGHGHSLTASKMLYRIEILCTSSAPVRMSGCHSALGPADSPSSAEAMFRRWPVSGAGTTALEQGPAAHIIGVWKELLDIASPTCQVQPDACSGSML